MLISATQRLLENRREARVRQWGAFTSFSLPDAHYSERIWRFCDGSGHWRSWGLRRDLARERELLERLVRRYGCDLIIDPHPRYSTRGDAAKRARLETLVEFLKESRDNEGVRAVVLSSAEPRSPGNLLLLGDWFLAESITPRPGLGYLQTLGTWHAPSVLARVDEFDRVFKRELSQYCREGDSSREKAIEDLEQIIAGLPDPRETYGTEQPEEKAQTSEDLDW